MHHEVRTLTLDGRRVHGDHFLEGVRPESEVPWAEITHTDLLCQEALNQRKHRGVGRVDVRAYERIRRLGPPETVTARTRKSIVVDVPGAALTPRDDVIERRIVRVFMLLLPEEKGLLAQPTERAIPEGQRVPVGHPRTEPRWTFQAHLGGLGDSPKTRQRAVFVPRLSVRTQATTSPRSTASGKLDGGCFTSTTRTSRPSAVR